MRIEEPSPQTTDIENFSSLGGMTQILQVFLAGLSSGFLVLAGRLHVQVQEIGFGSLLFLLLFLSRQTVQLLKLLVGEHVPHSLADDGQRGHEEGEHDRGLLDGLEAIQDYEANHLDEGVQVHTHDGKLLHVVVLGVLGRIPDSPEFQPVKEVVAGQAGNPHVEEHALQHRPWKELQHRGKEECETDEHVYQKISRALLHHLHRHLTLTPRHLLHIVRGQRDHVSNARHRGGHRKGKAEHGASWQRKCSADKEVKMISRTLCEIVGRPIHNHGGQVLVQVPQHRKANCLGYVEIK